MRWARKTGKQIPSKVKKNKESKQEKQPSSGVASSSESSPLELENAALRERIAMLEEKVRKLQNAIAELK